MERETQIQYSYLEHLGDTLNGHFYKSMDSSLSEIIIFYRNKTKGTTNRFTNIDEFIDSYCASLKKSMKSYYAFDYALLNWRKGTKSLICTWKQRVIFLIENRKDILITLLTRKDFESKVATSEAILRIYDWLSTVEKNDDIADWILNIENIKPSLEVYKISESNFKIESIGQKNRVTESTKYNYFWQLLNGKTDKEKKRVFDLINSKLSDKYINQPDYEIYQWKNESKGKLRYICGLIYVLTENNYLTVKISPKDLADLINQWLKHTCKTSSLEKELQPEELKIFTEKKQYKYTEDFFAYFPPKKS